MSKEEEILEEARKRYKVSREHVEENYRAAVEDLKFIAGEQWTEDAKKIRKGRPIITINKTDGNLQHSIGEFRANRPAIKVKPVDSDSDPELAEILGGLIRGIEQRSQAEVAYDSAYEGVAACGYGAFRVLTDYVDDEAWEQEIKVERVTNQFSICWDPSSDTFIPSEGARWLFVEDEITKEEFEASYPKVDPFDFETDLEQSSQWKGEEDKIKIAEYFRKVPVKKTVYRYQTEDGYTTTTEEIPGLVPEQSREVDSHKLEWYKIDGKNILEGPIELPCNNIPVIVVIGKEININGKKIVRGLVRNAKEPARIYNYMWSSEVESIALAPKAPWVGTAKQIGPYHQMWKDSADKNIPVLLYDTDERAQGPPQRTQPAHYNSAADRAMMLASDDLKATMNTFDASRGAQSNETSGKAINARVRQGNIANFTYTDNMTRGITYGGKVMLEMMPNIYDTERVIRILGIDGTEEFEYLNKTIETEDGPMVVNDITQGKYDIVATAGPSYETQRQEAVESQMQFMNAIPHTAPAFSDLVAKNQDWPQADEISDRLRKMLPAGLVEPEEGEEPPPPPPPSPQEQAEAKKLMQEVALGEQEIKKGEIELATAEIKKRQAEVELEDAVLEVVEKRNASIVPNQ